MPLFNFEDDQEELAEPLSEYTPPSGTPLSAILIEKLLKAGHKPHLCLGLGDIKTWEELNKEIHAKTHS